MTVVRTILVPLDGSQLAASAVPYAAWLARAADARLLLVHARPVTALSASHPEAGLIEAARARELWRRAMHQLATVSEDLSHTGLPVSVCLARGAPSDVILDIARARHADLIAMSSHGEGGLSRALYGSVADAVLRRADVPVLLVTPRCAVSLPDGSPLRVLAALDGSPLAERAFHEALSWTAAVSVELIVLRIVDFSNRDQQIGIAETYLAQLRITAAAAAKPLSRIVEHGRAADTILRVADEQRVHMIAMGTHGRSGLQRMLLGSVATSVLARTHVPLLLSPERSLWGNDSASTRGGSRPVAEPVRA